MEATATASPSLSQDEKATLESRIGEIMTQISKLNTMITRRCERLSTNSIPAMWGDSGMPATFNSNNGEHCWSQERFVAQWTDELLKLSAEKRALLKQLE